MFFILLCAFSFPFLVDYLQTGWPGYQSFYRWSYCCIMERDMGIATLSILDRRLRKDPGHGGYEQVHLSK